MTDFILEAPTLRLVLIRGALAGALLMTVLCVLGFGYGLLFNVHWIVPLFTVLSAISCVIYAILFPGHSHRRLVVRAMTAFATAYVFIAGGFYVCGPLYFLATRSAEVQVQADEFVYPLFFAAVFALLYMPVLLFSTRPRRVRRGFSIQTPWLPK